MMKFFELVHYHNMYYQTLLNKFYANLDEASLKEAPDEESQKYFIREMRGRFIQICAVKAVLQDFNDEDFFQVIQILGGSEELALFLDKLDRTRRNSKGS